MRFLARRFAAGGGAYFLGESNQAVSFDGRVPSRGVLGDSDTPVNELRRDLHDEPVDSEAVAEGLAYARSWKAFGIATVIVFGSVSLILGLVATKLEIDSRHDIRVKGRDLIQPKVETVRSNKSL